jgi:hypothetical protein
MQVIINALFFLESKMGLHFPRVNSSDLVTRLKVTVINLPLQTGGLQGFYCVEG